MKNTFWKIIAPVAISTVLLPSVAFATYDLSLSENSVTFSKAQPFLEGQVIKIYANIQNNSGEDAKGTVKFFLSRGGAQIEGDQPVSALGEKNDAVFVSKSFDAGTYDLYITVSPFGTTDSNSANNSVTKHITVLQDSDRDGRPNTTDLDDDNDGVPDTDDAFPLDRKETRDTDGDGTGDNADTDDDNDGVPDTNDLFPLDPNESKDSDKDGVADGKDLFPTDPTESADFDSDGIGDNADPDADNDGVLKTDDFNDTNKGPSIKLSVNPGTAYTNKEVTFDASKTNDPDGSLRTIRLEIYKMPSSPSDNKSVMAIQTITDEGRYVYKFNKPGKYTAIVTAVDNKGETNSRTKEIRIYSLGRYIGLWALGILVLIIIVILFLKRPKPSKKGPSNKKPVPQKSAPKSHKKRLPISRPKKTKRKR